MCKCVLYYCHRVSTQLQLTNISYIISYHISYRIVSYIIYIIYIIISYISYISYHTISYRIVSYHIASYRIIYHIISYRIIYRVVSCHVISYHISYRIIYHIISCIISHHIIYHIISIISTDCGKNNQISNFMKIRPVGAELLRSDVRTDTTKLNTSRCKPVTNSVALYIPADLFRTSTQSVADV